MPNEEQNDQNNSGPQGPYNPIVPESSEATTTAIVPEEGADSPDDAILKSASNEVNDEMGVPPSESNLKPKKSGKKFFKILFFLLLIAGAAAAAYWYFMIYTKPATAPAPAAPVQETPAAQTFEPDSVAYAFRSKDSESFTLFSRPAIGGDRIEASKLGKEDDYPASRVSGQNVVIDFDNKLQMSSDGGKTYTQILETEAGQEITDVAFSADGTKLGVAINDTEGESNTVSSMDLDGQNAAEIFTSKDHAGIRIMGWDAKTVVYDTFVPNSDGGKFDPHAYSVETKKHTKLIDIDSGSEVISTAVSDDLTKLVYSSGKTDNDSDDPFPMPLAPHTITELVIESGNEEIVGTVGKLGEKAKNGNALPRDTQVGFLINSTTPYYTDQGKLFVADNDEATLAHESDNNIIDVKYVSEDLVIASTGEFDNFVLSNYSRETKAAITILEGDANTVIFGVTTK